MAHALYGQNKYGNDAGDWAKFLSGWGKTEYKANLAGNVKV